MRRWCGVCVLGVIGAHASPSLGQPADREIAQSHFEAGRKHVKAGRCDLAIEEFKASIDFEPSSVGARLNLGDCYVALGRRTDAFRQYKEAEAAAARINDPRLEDARLSAARVGAKLVRVVLREEEPVVSDLTVKVDGVPVGPRPWMIVVEPDAKHTIEATALDGRRWVEDVRGKAGAVVRLTIALREPAGDEGAAAPPVVVPERQGNPLETSGLVIGGVGAAGVITGAVFGVLALTARGELADTIASDPRCSGGYPAGSCDPATKSELAPIEERAFLASTVSTVAFIAGGAMLGAGAVLYVLSRSDRPKSATARLRIGAGAFLEGAF